MSIIEKVVSLFVAVVFLLFVLRYPDKIVEFLNLFVDAASNVADSLAQAGE